ncbi:DNA repair protein XRCC4 isoform X1 [Brienomyrus brachyistius]|uniref:DNA repair protein XRCC4 isoform X1 n=2 Tax=Brienomyrus brachyistius TaxID=42636 RepID=UPI0020B3D1E1|nr:DNA repair protein XRCC4 isoform X1 [Brienomyrus brachyistius]
MSTSVRKISIASEPDQPFFLRLDWADDLGAGFVVVLCDGTFAWSGEVSEDDVTREAQELEMQREKYVQDLHLALVGGDQIGDYSFHLSPSHAQGGAVHLSYEKVLKDFSFKLGVVELQTVPDPVDVIKDLISHGLERSTELQARNMQLQEENQRLRQEQEHITSELERYVQGKEVLERELYTRFVLVLNEKKAKIRSQKENIEKLLEELEKNALRREADLAKGRAPSESAGSPSRVGDTYEGSTDEEHSGSTHSPPAPERPMDEKPACTSFDDSLTDIIDVAPCRKRRHRHLQNPRVEVEKLSEERRERKRKETKQDPLLIREEENAAAKARVDPEADDLFDDF